MKEFKQLRQENKSEASEDLNTQEALEFVRRVGCLLGDTAKPVLYNHGNKYFIASAFEDQVEVFDVDHLRPTFSFTAPWKIRFLQCFDECSVVSDGLTIAKFVRDEKIAEFQSKTTIIQILSTKNVILVLTEFAVLLLGTSNLEQVGSLTFGKDIQNACWIFHPRNHQDKILTGHNDGAILMWNVKTKSKLRSFRTAQLPPIISQGPDDNVIVFGWSDGRIQLFDLDSGQLMADFNHHKRLLALAFRQDGVPQLLSFHEDSASLWEFKDQTIDCVYSTDLCFKPVHAEFLPSKPVLLCFGVNCLQEFLLENDKLSVIRSRSGIPAGIDFVEFYSEGNFNEQLSTNVCAMSSSPASNTHVAIHNLFADNRGFELSHGKVNFPARCSHMALFDRRDVPWANAVTAHGDCTYAWSIPERKIYADSVQKFDSTITSLNISPCGNYYAAGCLDGSIHVLVLQSHRHIISKHLPSKGSTITLVAFDASGRGLLWTDANGDVMYTPDFRSQMPQFILRIQGSQSGKASYYNSDAWLLFVADADLNIITIDIEYKRMARIFSGHTAPITAVVASDDGRWLFSGAQDGTIRLWDISSGLQCLQVNCQQVPRALALSPHGRFLVSAHTNQLGLRLWSFDAFKVQHKPFTTSESFIKTENLDELIGSLDELKITPLVDQQKWISILNWKQTKTRAAPKVPVEKSSSAPFFLSDLAYEELKRKEKTNTSETKSDLVMDYSLKEVQFDFDIDNDKAGQHVCQEMSPSQIHSLFYFMYKDIHKHERMLSILQHIITNSEHGLFSFDVVTAVIKVYLEYHLDFIKENFPQQCELLANALEAVYRPFEERIQRALGDIAFATGNLL